MVYLVYFGFPDVENLHEIEEQLEELDQDFRHEKMGGDEYVQKRQSLKQIKDSLREELSRMGVIT